MIRALLALIESKTAITDVLGDPLRLFPRILPQGMNTFPAATYRWVNNVDTADFSGASTFDFGYIDLFCYAKTYGGSVDLYELLRYELETQSIIHNEMVIDEIFYMPSGAEDYLEELNLNTKMLELKIAYYRQTKTTT